MTSTVKKWFSDRGFGFLHHPEGGRDLFLHFSDIIGKAGEPQPTELPVGAAVEFEIGQGAKGDVAKHVRLLNSSPSPGGEGRGEGGPLTPLRPNP